jgi:hypothetical protein
LVSAIEKATGKPLNAIVAKEYEGIVLPPVKVSGATVASLFEALQMACQGLSSPTSDDGWFLLGYGFSTRETGTNVVWYFSGTRNHSPNPQKYCRFYQLADFLKNYRVEDITTAIQTGWELLGVKSPPTLKFHPETKLLIAVGPPEHLKTIDSVLEELRKTLKPGGESHSVLEEWSSGRKQELGNTRK